MGPRRGLKLEEGNVTYTSWDDDPKRMGAFSWIEAKEGITAMFWPFLGGCVVGAVSAWVVMG